MFTFVCVGKLSTDIKIQICNFDELSILFTYVTINTSCIYSIL